MIRSALLALDTTEASAVALEKAIGFCQYFSARADDSESPIHLTGIGVVDRSDIKRPKAVPVGATGFKIERDKALLADARRKVETLLDNFQARCREAAIPCSTAPCEGSPYEQIERVAHQHDVIFIGRDTNFHFETRDRSTDTLKRLLRDHPRPLIVTPPEDTGKRSIVIAYDGSLQGSRALHLWALLGLRRVETEIHVISVNRRESEAQQLCDEAMELLSHHEIPATAHPIASSQRAVSVLLERIPELEPRMIVMGAFGAGGFREHFFGTATKWMIKNCPYPMFLHH